MPAFDWLRDLLSLAYPCLCCGCGNALVQGEREICLQCLQSLDYTRFHTQTDNAAEQLLWGKAPIEHGTAWFRFYKQGISQALLHQLKYQGHSLLGQELGLRMGYELKNSRLAQCDCLVPVPLHKRKLRQRGYNQSLMIALGLSESMHIPVCNSVLVRTRYNQTQTHKGVWDRWQNSQDLFALNNGEQLRGKHVLLVDDVLTTGATIEACARVLLTIKEVKVSFATLAMATR